MQQANSNGKEPSVDIQREVVRRQALERQKGIIEGKLMEYDDDGRPFRWRWVSSTSRKARRPHSRSVVSSPGTF